MTTTHGAAADAEMARMERESGGHPIPTKTFKDARSALENAKKLLAKGEISKAEYNRLEAKLRKQSQSEDLTEYLGKTYGKRR